MEEVRGPLVEREEAADVSMDGRANISVKEERRRRPVGEPLGSSGLDMVVVGAEVSYMISEGLCGGCGRHGDGKGECWVLFAGVWGLADAGLSVLRARAYLGVVRKGPMGQL